MESTAQELTKLLTETKKARESLDKVLDFVDLIKKRLDDLPDSVRTSGEGIRENAEEIGKYIEEISNHINDLIYFLYRLIKMFNIICDFLGAVSSYKQKMVS